MTKIYFVRHSKVDYIEDDLTRPLSKEGKELLFEMEQYFEKLHIDNILSSPYHRAINTVKGIANSKSLEIELIDNFRERKVSDRFIEDFNSFAINQWNDFDYKLENGESHNDVKKRGIESLYRILGKYKDKSIIVGIHGTILAMIINYFDNNFGYNEWKKLNMPDIFLFEFDNDELINISNIKYKLKN